MARFTTNVETCVDVDIDIDVNDFFDEMDSKDKETMARLLLDDTDLVIAAIKNDKFIKELVYHLKYSDSTHLELLKNELDYKYNFKQD